MATTTTLRNGCRVLLEAPHKDHPERRVVLAVVREPMGVACWQVDARGNAYWGAYGFPEALAAYYERTGRRMYPVRSPWAAIREDIETPEDIAALLRLAAEMLDRFDDGEDHSRYLEDTADEIEEMYREGQDEDDAEPGLTVEPAGIRDVWEAHYNGDYWIVSGYHASEGDAMAAARADLANNLRRHAVMSRRID